MHSSVPHIKTAKLLVLLCSVHSLFRSSCNSRQHQRQYICSSLRTLLCRRQNPLQQFALRHSNVYRSHVLRHLDILDLQALCASCRTLCRITQNEATTGQTKVCHES